MAIRFGKLKINRLWVLVVVALVLGLLATWLSVTYLRNREAAMQTELAERVRGGAVVSVIVATRDLPVGAILDDSVVAAREIQADLVYADTLSAEQFEEVAGKPLLQPALKGRPLMRGQVIDARPRDFAQTIHRGMRAFTMDIDELNSIAQMIKPGDRIDLYLISNAPAADGSSQAQQQIYPFLQHVKVVATGRRTNAVAAGPNAEPARPEEQFQTVTVEVRPEEAAVIALAQQTGRIRTTLRSPADNTSARFGVLTTSHLLGAATRAPSARDASTGAPVRVEYIVGGKGGAGAAPPININVPGLSVVPGMPGATAAAIPGMPAAVNQAVHTAAAAR